MLLPVTCTERPYTSATYRSVDIMKALFESNAEFDLEVLSNTLNSIYSWGSREALQLILKHDAKKMLGIQQFSSGLSHAAQSNNRQAVVYWLNEHPEHHNLVVDPATVIRVSEEGFMDVLPPLTERIRSTNSFEKTLSECLQVASKTGHEQVVEYSIGKGANVNAVVQEVVRRTNRFRHNSYNHVGESIRKLSALQAALVRYKFLRNTQSSRTRADASSQQRIVELLLRKGADPNRAEGYGRYPLNIAAAYCTVEVVQALISSGANVETATEEYETALQTAAGRELGGLPIIKTLLEASGSTSSFGLGKAAALNAALSFFGTPGCSRDRNTWRFFQSVHVADVFSAGPGAVVKILLANLPEEKADDTRYGLLAQMACIAGDQECVELLIKRGLDVNVLGSYYGTALQAASRVGNIQIVDCLLKSGADVNVLSGAHGTALRAAVIQGHEDPVRMLISRGADVNLRHKDEDQLVLHLALEKRNSAISKILLDAGADVEPKVKGQEHIMIVACKHGDSSLVELLLASVVDVNVSGINQTRYYHFPYKEATPLHAACAYGHISVVRLLLDYGADIEKTVESSGTPLIAAIRSAEAAKDCKLEIVEELLSAGATIGGSSTKGNALARACDNHQHVVTELLLANLSGTQYEAEVSAEALSAAIKCGNEEMIRLLLESGVPPSFKLLRQACAVGVLGVIRMLVDTSIDVNGVDGDDAPLLHIAACHLRSDIVQFLINQGSDITIRSTKYGSPFVAALEGSVAPLLRSYSQPKSCQVLAEQLPLPVIVNSRAVKFGYRDLLQCEKIVRSLFNAGAEVDKTIRKFGNALHLASYMGSEVIVRQILERGEDVNIFGGYFETALIAGLKADHPIIVDLLLDRGIEVNRYSPEHGFALHCACASGIKKLTQSLLDHGADVNAYDNRHGSALAVAASCRDIRTWGGRPSEGQRAIVNSLLHHEPKVQIREYDLLAATSWYHPKDRQYFMSLFFQHDPSSVATEAVIIKAIQQYPFDEEIVSLLLKHDGGLGTTPTMVEAAGMLTDAARLEVTKMLLEHRPLNQATAELLKSMRKRAAPEQSIGMISRSRSRQL